MNEQEITPAEQRVLDAVMKGDMPCHYGGVELCEHEQAVLLAALREYGAEQRAAGWRAAIEDTRITTGANDG